MIFETAAVAPELFATVTGWDPKPEGLCRGDVCVPAPDIAAADGTIDVTAAAARLSMPVVSDDATGVVALGPPVGPVLSHSDLPDLTLTTRTGDAFPLASLAGRRTVMVAWASW